MAALLPETKNGKSWDHSSDPNFLDYYEQQSVSTETLRRFTSVRDRALRLLAGQPGHTRKPLEIADIGCGAGTQSRLWAKFGHHAHGLDVNAPLIELAKKRASTECLDIAFDVGSATDLPYQDASMDVVLLPELLEHVANWQGCLDEAIRILKPGGLLYLSTTNWLCPVQDEFNLPMYSWYPRFLKQRYEQLAVTTRPEIANHCKYPAVNWFTFYSLKRRLKRLGFRCMDRFDTFETEGAGSLPRLAVRLIRSLPPLRFFAHIMTNGTVVFAFKS